VYFDNTNFPLQDYYLQRWIFDVVYYLDRVPSNSHVVWNNYHHPLEYPLFTGVYTLPFMEGEVYFFNKEVEGKEVWWVR
jgi:hypothetical protein